MDRDDIERRAERARTRVRESQRDMLAALAGSELSSLLESRDRAATFLVSGVSSLRRAAIHALTFQWHVSPGTTCAARILDMAHRDAAAEVRLDALRAIGIIYRETDDSQVGCVLARRVVDEAESLETRKAAFIGLCFLRAAFTQSGAINTFPQGVDWAFVERFLDPSRSPEPVDPRTTFAELFRKRPKPE